MCCCNDENILALSYKEFKEKDIFNAFSEFMPVSEAKRIGYIPLDFTNAFNDKCVCGSDIIIKCSADIPESEWFTKVMCCNPRCYHKVGLTLERIIKTFGGRDIASESCIKIAKHFLSEGRLKYKSAIEILMIPPREICELIDSRKAQAYVDFLNKFLNSKLSYPELVASVGIPLMEDTCKKVFQGVNSFNDFIELKHKYGSIEKILNNSGVYDKKKMFFLQEYLPDIYLAEVLMQTNIRRQGLQKIVLCITGSLKLCNFTRKEYINFLNEVGRGESGEQYFEFVEGSAMKSCAYVVADYPSNSAKYRAGKTRNVLIDSEGLALKVIQQVQELDKSIYGKNSENKQTVGR